MDLLNDIVRLDKKLLKREYLRNISVVSLGTISAQIIPLIFYPILTRLYSPADFGLLATIISITGIMGVISTLKYETAILIVKTKALAAQLIWGILFISAFFSFVTFLVFIFCGNFISGILNEPLLKRWILICPFISFLIVIYQCYNEWCVRNKSFKQLAVSKVLNTTPGTLLKYALNYGLKGNGLLLGDFLGRLISAFQGIFFVYKYDMHFFSRFSIRNIKLIFFRYKNCPKFFLPAQLLNTLGIQIPIFLIAALYSQRELGFFSMAFMIISLPASVISISVKDVFRQRASVDYCSIGNCVTLFMKTMTVLSILSVLGFGLFMFISVDLFKIVLGEEWARAGVFARILCPIVAINFVAEVGSALYVIMEKIRIYLVWQIFYLICSSLPFVLSLILEFDLIVTLWMYSVSMSCLHLVNILVTYRLSKGN